MSAIEAVDLGLGKVVARPEARSLPEYTIVYNAEKAGVWKFVGEVEDVEEELRVVELDELVEYERSQGGQLTVAHEAGDSGGTLDESH